ncbi:MAG TPA: DoxX family protein [Gemmatimonadaceae bacterium]|nr:DoxX family protein [Gemmatimonadaceae bacterium]
MDTTFSADALTIGLGLLIARLVLGLLMAAHGAQKLFGWFGGHGLAGTGGFFESIGFRPGRLFATAAALGELASGLLVALGFLGPVGPAIMLAVMIVAAMSVHWQNGLFATSNGIELPLLYATGAAALALVGPGRYSLDTLLGLTPVWTPAVTWVAIAIGVVGGVLNMAVRRPAAPPRAPSV